MAWDTRTREGSKAYEENRDKIIARILAWPTPTVHRYLKDKGWIDLGWLGPRHQWRMPETRVPNMTRYRVLAQTQAVRWQVHFDLEDQGLLKWVE